MATIGYARVSTVDQDPALQLDALTGCERVFVDKASGKNRDRPQLAACLDYLRPGDTLLVWRLDRLARSTRHLLEVADDLNGREVGLRTVDGMALDTSTAVGRMVITVLAAVAEMELELNRERTLEGLAAARKRGRVGGRPRALRAEDVEKARDLIEAGWSKKAVAETLGCARSTLYSALG